MLAGRPSTPRAASMEPITETDPAVLRQMVEELQRSNMKLTAALGKKEPQGEADGSHDAPTNSRTPGKVNELRAIRAKRTQAQVWATADVAHEMDALDEGALVDVVPKSVEQTARILAALAKKAPFDSLEATQQKLVANAMTLLDANAGAVLVKEGDEGQQCYLLEKGELRVRVQGTERDRIQPGEIFGELALLYDVPRTASIEAITDVSLFVLDRPAFQRTLRTDAISRRREIWAFLRSCVTFKPLDDRTLSRVTDVVETCEYTEGTAVIKEDDTADAMFFLKEVMAQCRSRTCQARSHASCSLPFRSLLC